MELIKKIIEAILGLFGSRNENDSKLADEPIRSSETDAEKEASDEEKKEVKEEVVYMVSMSEILKKAKLEDQTPEIQANLHILVERVNVVRTKYAKPMQVTSGLRTMEDHLRIYRQIAERKGVPFDQSKVPMKSTHLFGQAVDIYDPNKELQKWCIDNVAILEEVGLWMEDFSATPNWCHFQIIPPRSGKRFFLP